MLIDEENYLEHYGKKGMRWRKRGTRRVQRSLNRFDKIATGKASKTDRLLSANRGVFTKKGANRVLQRGANNQAKINSGKLKVTNALAVVGGVKVKNLDFHKQGDAKAKMDSGQKAAVAVLAGVTAVRVAGLVSRR